MTAQCADAGGWDAEAAEARKQAKAGWFTGLTRSERTGVEIFVFRSTGTRDEPDGLTDGRTDGQFRDELSRGAARGRYVKPLIARRRRRINR